MMLVGGMGFLGIRRSVDVVIVVGVCFVVGGDVRVNLRGSAGLWARRLGGGVEVLGLGGKAVTTLPVVRCNATYGTTVDLT